MPQVASVGLTEQAAKDKGYEVKVGKFPFIGNGKAIALGEPEGLVKTVFDAKTGELLGAHMIGAEVTELIQGYTIAKTMETTEAELMHTVFPHPTLSEMMHEVGAGGLWPRDPYVTDRWAWTWASCRPMDHFAAQICGRRYRGGFALPSSLWMRSVAAEGWR